MSSDGCRGEARSQQTQALGRTAAVLVVGLAVVHVLHLSAAGDGPLWLWILVGGTFLVCVPVAVALWRCARLECRVFAVLVASGSGVAHLLVMTLGRPGGQPAGWTAEGGVALGLAAAVVALIARETLLRVRTERSADPYA